MKTWLLTICSFVLVLFVNAASGAQELAAGDVRIGPGDVVKLKVFGQPDLSDLYEVLPDGTLAIPGLGRIQDVQRLSDARAGVGQLMDTNFGLPGTHFSVTIATLRPVTVGGDVESPGEVPYKIGLRIAQAIALAGGPSRNRSIDNLGRLIQVNQEHERLTLAELRLARALITEARLLAEARNSVDFEIPARALELIGPAQAERLRQNQIRIARTNASAHGIAKKRVSAAAEINTNDIQAQRLSGASLQSQLDLVRADLERLAPLIERQAITGDRILSLRRDVAQIEGLVGQAIASLAKTETEQAILAEEGMALDLQRSLSIVSQLVATEAEIMDATASMAAINASLDSARDLPFVADARDPGPGRCKVAILRTSDEGAAEILPVDVLTVLNPGDHVEVGPITRDCDSSFF